MLLHDYVSNIAVFFNSKKVQVIQRSSIQTKYSKNVYFNGLEYRKESLVFQHYWKGHIVVPDWHSGILDKNWVFQ